jgi:hypothetical protein
VTRKRATRKRVTRRRVTRKRASRGPLTLTLPTNSPLSLRLWHVR